jgi:DNA-binding MarR family transcriptional regulator
MWASAVMRHLDRLEAWGWITREIGVARSIRLSERNPLLKPDPLTKYKP